MSLMHAGLPLYHQATSFGNRSKTVWNDEKVDQWGGVSENIYPQPGGPHNGASKAYSHHTDI